MTTEFTPKIKVIRKKKRIYHYAVVGGKYIQIKGEPGSLEYKHNLAEAVKPGNTLTVTKLVDRYLKSHEFTQELSERTQKVRKSYLDQIVRYFGDFDVRSFENMKARKVIAAFHDEKDAFPRAADYRIQTLSALLNFAVDKGEITSHVCQRFKKKYQGGKRAKLIWTKDDLERLRQHTSVEVYNVALFASLTGARRADILSLKWSQVSDDRILYTASKTDTDVEFPMYDELQALIDTLPKKSEFVFLNSRGQPWTSGFGSSWNKAVKAAGIDLHFHDLRGTFVTRVFESGEYTPKDIAPLVGWDEKSVERIVKRYCPTPKVHFSKLRNALSRK